MTEPPADEVEVELPDAEPYDTRWQYRLVNVGAFFAPSRLGMTLSFFGQRGWELVSVYDKASNWLNGIENGIILFKKPVPPGDEPDGAWTEVWTSAQVEHAYNKARQEARDARRAAKAARTRQSPTGPAG